MIKQQKNIITYQKDMSDSINKMFNFALNELNIRKNENLSILDIGSCDGSLLRKIRKVFPNFKTFGLELNSSMQQLATELDKKQNLTKNINYITENANNIENIDSQFDIILMSKVLHEIFSYDNPKLNNKSFSINSIALFFESLFEKLKSNGKILVRDPAKPDFPATHMYLKDINSLNGEKNSMLVNKLSTAALLNLFLKNFKPAKDNYSFEGNNCILPKWLISEFIRHRKFTFNNEIWKDELNEQYGTVLPSELKKIVKDIGYRIEQVCNIGSLLINNKYALKKDEFSIQHLNNSPIILTEFPSNLLAILKKD